LKSAAHFINKKILITGGNGYVASNVIQLLKDVPCKVIRLDRVGTAWNNIDFGNKIELQNIEGDIRDANIWEPLLDGVDIIYHFAAQTSIAVSNKNPVADLEINVLPILRLMEACQTKKTKPVVIYSGTVTEAGFTPQLPVSEAHADRPITMYDIHKLTAENYIKHFTNERVILGAILRLANVYGPGPKSSQADRGILNQMMAKAIRGESLTVYGDGKFIRDYVFITDVARAFVEAAINIEHVNGQHFMIGTGKGTSIQEAFQFVAKRVASRGKKQVPVLNVAPPLDLPLIENRNFVADISSFKSLTGWTPQVSLEQGVDITIDWYLN
jgi:UDP-glucose 4-epimerase